MTSFFFFKQFFIAIKVKKQQKHKAKLIIRSMPPEPLESALIFSLLQICSDFATYRKKLRVQKFGAPS